MSRHMRSGACSSRTMLWALACLAPPSGALAAQDAVAETRALPGRDWPQFRGIAASGIADTRPLPSAWDVAAGTHVLWRTPVAGLSHASPIVWDDRVYVVTAVAEGLDPELKVGLYGEGDSATDMVEHSFRVLCLDRAEGTVLWDRVACSTKPAFARHTKATHANSTPATDGAHVVALFATGGLFCFDRDGELAWNVDLGPLDVGPHNGMDLQWGFASSPVIAHGLVIVQADVKEAPFLAAFDLETGATVWKVARDDLTGWCTPLVCDAADGARHVIVNGCRHMGAYRLEDGAEVWRMAGGGGIPVPTPVAAAGHVFLTSNHRPIAPNHPDSPIFVVRTSARGDLGVPLPDEPGEHLAWVAARRGTYMQTPLVYRGLALFGKDNGVVAALDAATGDPHVVLRLGSGNDGFSASPVAGDGKVYFTSESGTVYVLDAANDLETIATNSLDEICMATPAIADGTLIFRTRAHVVAIGAD